MGSNQKLNLSGKLLCLCLHVEFVEFFLLSKFQVKIFLVVLKSHSKSALIFVTFYPNLQKTKQNDCGDFEIAKIDFT